MVMNKLRHQDNGIANHQKLTSNTGPLLPKPVLWFQLSWGALTIMSLIMVMLRLTLYSIHLNIPLTMLQI